MKNQIITKGLLLGISLILMSFDLPNGWHRDGDAPGLYDMGIDIGAGPDGKNAATIKSHVKKIIGHFGTLAQTCWAGCYLGKKIKMTATVKSENVDDWAGLWLRVDNTCTGEILSFDNMVDRPIKGTIEWKSYEIILDVPVTATVFSYGALLSGTGQIWFTNFKFEIIGDTAPENVANANNIKVAPLNLNFEE